VTSVSLLPQGSRGGDLTVRCIFAGVEYAGKSTLSSLLQQHYQQRQQRVHMDDHFTIPDNTLSPESRAAMVAFPDDVKERMQRMQIQYHIEVLQNYPNVVISGWHLEEAVYSELYGDDPDSPYYPRYGYRTQRIYESMVLETRLPDLVLVHVTASDESIRQRMKSDPHEYQIIREESIAAAKERFAEEIDRSLFTHKGWTIELDTTDKTPEESFDEFLLLSEPRLTVGEVALRMAPVPDGEYEVRYEGGIRRMVPADS